MRLLQTSTISLVEFASNAIPPYGILSHTWEEGEVSFQEMQIQQGSTTQSSSKTQITSKKGYEKIKKCCEIAAADGFEYAWVDTCCIDKTSSSELSEAINSMWGWYEAAEVCYAYLSDVTYLNELQVDRHSFAKSRWFTRGWTLQELIAPRSVIFYSQCWREIGTRSSLRSIISPAARIHDKALGGSNSIKGFSVAQKMSWASTRQTTRIEDLAYSLMGIFDVNMPMLYGEGSRAFFRLQEEIIRKTDDQSIFAWQLKNSNGEFGGILASSPAAFSASHRIIRTDGPITLTASIGSGSFTITNKGVLLNLPIKRQHQALMVVLDCRFDNFPQSLIAFLIYNGNHNTYGGLWKRGNYDSLLKATDEEVKEECQWSRVYVQMEFLQSSPTDLLQSFPPAFITASKRFIDTGVSVKTLGSSGRLQFVPQIGLINRFHFVSFKLGCFVVKVTLSFVWKKLRVEASEFSTVTAIECQRDGLVTSEKAWYSHPNPDDLAEPPDRIIFPIPAGTHLLLIAIRSRIVSGLKIQEVELDVCEKVTSPSPRNLFLGSHEPAPQSSHESQEATGLIQ